MTVVDGVIHGNNAYYEDLKRKSLRESVKEEWINECVILLRSIAVSSSVKDSFKKDAGRLLNKIEEVSDDSG